MESATLHLTPGSILAERYRIESVLGQGGMGAVYLAQIDALNKQVAIKEMRVQGQDAKHQQQAVEQFRQEARFLAHLEHPHLVQVNDFFVDNDRYYLVMAYIKGQTLQELLTAQRGPLPVSQVLEWATQLTSVLSYLHQQTPPILFRDLKPSNIMLDSQRRIRLIDFGIARSFEAGSNTATFLQGVGSAGYSPLEQYQGAGGTDPRSDIYSLGATLFHLLSNQVPPSPVELVTTGLAIPSVRRINPQVPPGLDKIIHKMMALRKEERFSSMQQVQQLLEQMTQVLQESGHDGTENLGATPLSPSRMSGSPQRQATGPIVVSQVLHPQSAGDSLALWLTAGGLTLAAVSLFAWMFLQSQRQIALDASSPGPSPSLIGNGGQREPKPTSRPQAPKPKPPVAPKVAAQPNPPSPTSPPVEPRGPSRLPRPLQPPSLPVQPIRPIPRPSLGGNSHYPTAENPPRRRLGRLIPETPAPNLSTSPTPTEVPTAVPTPGQEILVQAGSPGYWGTHPGFDQPLGPFWVQDEAGNFHPPPGAPMPPIPPSQRKPGKKIIKILSAIP